MAILIDGHNLIPHIAGLSLQQLDDETELIKRIQHYCAKRSQNAEIYFDRAAPGESGPRKYGRVTAIFVPRGRTADSAIRGRLAQLGRAARNWSVITSDRQVQAEARSAGAKVIPSPEFAAILIAAPASTEADHGQLLSPQEIAGWLELFRPGGTDHPES